MNADQKSNKTKTALEGLGKWTASPGGLSDGAQVRGSALAELERQSREARAKNSTRYLTWPERQRLVDAPAAPVLPMLLAVGMIWVFSMSLMAHDDHVERPRIHTERFELPFVPHESDTPVGRRDSEVEEESADSDAESSRLLLYQKREFLSQDEGDRPVDWVENQASLRDSVLRKEDIQLLLRLAPSDLIPLTKSVLAKGRKLRPRSHARQKIVSLLQEDIIAAAELVLLCRVLALNGSMDEAQAERLHELLRLVAKRFGEEWPKVIGLSLYVPSVRESNLYLRLINLVAGAVEATGRFCLSSHKYKDSATREQEMQGLAWRLMTSRLEIQQHLEKANLPGDIAEVFRID